MDKPETVHDLLLQNSNAIFDLVVWDERVRGPDKVRVDLGRMRSCDHAITLKLRN